MTHHIRRNVLPFTAIVGQDVMKKALLLNAINPQIGGVLIRGDKGTAKSTAVRALAEVLPEIEVVKDCRFNCNPSDEHEMCDLCFEKKKNGEVLTTIKKRVKVIDLPLGVTEERVVGTMDVERALQEGIKALEPGILANVNRGILYIDEINLLDDHVADVLLDSAAMGVNIVEREGISLSHPSKFILIGTMNPEEGELRPQLLDRFGLQVSVEGLDDTGQRMHIIRATEEFERDPDAFREMCESTQEELRDKISLSQKILPEVTIDDDLVELIVKTCIHMGVRTHRAEITIVRTAKTIAALGGRKNVSKDDVREAMELSLPHRMRRKPFEEPKLNPDRLDEEFKKAETDASRESDGNEMNNTEELKKNKK